MIDIFSVDINKELIINKPVVTSIPAFRAVLSRDRGSKGDSQGKMKLMAFKHLLYIYYVADLRSSLVLDGTKKSMIHSEALLMTGLPDTFRVDKVISTAIEKYKEMQLDTPEIRMLVSLKRGLALASKVVEVLIAKIEDDLEYYATADLVATSEGDLEVLGKEVDAEKELELIDPSKILKRLLDNIKKITSIGSDVNKTLATVKEVEEKIKRQMSEEGAVRGGVTLGNREIPK